MLILSDDVENNGMPFVNITLIVVNFVAFICLIGHALSAQAVVTEWGTVPGRMLLHHDAHDFLAIITSMFLHGGWLHLIGNMWVLYLFGDNVEDRLGHWTYLAFYLACGLFADFLHILSNPISMIPTIGASGAIAGVMGAYIALHPNAKCNTWFGDDFWLVAFRTYKIPAWFIIGGWFAIQVFCCQLIDSNVAFYAHIGGFLAGMGLLTFLKYKHYVEPNGESYSWSRGATALALFCFIWLSTSLVIQFNKTHDNKGKVTTISTVGTTSGSTAVANGGKKHAPAKPAAKSASKKKRTTNPQHSEILIGAQS